MSSPLGSLPEFLLPISRPSIYPSLSGNILKDPVFSMQKHRTPPPRPFIKNHNTFKLLQSNTPTKFKRRDTIQNTGTLDVYDKIREELILGNQQRLLRCMHSTVREEERQKKEAMLEKRALDTVLMSIGDDVLKHRGLRPKRISGRIVHRKKSAVFIDILSKEKMWIYKRKPLYF